MTQHFKLGASSAKRWMNCPGSIRLIANTPRFMLDLGSDYATEGTEAHELAERCLKEGQKTCEDEAVQVYLDEINNQIVGEEEVFVEKRFSLNKEMGGTNDCAILDTFTGELTIYDYKHGVGVPVEPEENPQLMYYAIGAIHSLEFDFSPEDPVNLVIVQPRCFHEAGPIRRWTTTVQRLLDFEQELLKAAEKTQDPEAPLCAGDHCRFCPAMAVCPAMKALIIEGYNNPALSENLKISKFLNMWDKSLKKIAYQSLSNGVEVPGYKLVEGRSSRSWKDANSLAEELKDKPEAFTEPSLKSPAQLEKLLGKEFVKEHQVIVKGALTLADESNKKPAKTQAQADFSDIELGDGHI